MVTGNWFTSELEETVATGYEITKIHNTIQYNTYLIDRSPWGLFRANETQRNDGTEQQELLRIPAGRRKTSWLFTSAARKLNQGLPGTNSTSGQNGS